MAFANWRQGATFAQRNPMFDFDFSRIPDLLAYDPKAPLLFSSGLFLFLFLGFFAVHQLLLGRSRLRIAWVVLFSLFFYYKCAGHFWLLHLVIVGVDFYLARCIEESVTPSDKRWMSVILGFTAFCVWLLNDIALADKLWMVPALFFAGIFLLLIPWLKISRGWMLVISLLVNLGMLVYFKYNVYSELWSEVSGKAFDPALVWLPAGISFFTFQSLSYTIDVYRRQLKALGNMLDYGFLEGDSVDVSVLVQEQLLLSVPVQPLCREDCQGICQRCGADLNREACRCAESEVDPRFAALKKLKLS